MNRRRVNRFEFAEKGKEILLTLDGDNISSGDGASYNLANRANSRKDYSTMRKQLATALVINQGQTMQGPEAWKQMGREDTYDPGLLAQVFAGICRIGHEEKFIFRAEKVAYGVTEYFTSPIFRVSLAESIPQDHPALQNIEKLGELALRA